MGSKKLGVTYFLGHDKKTMVWFSYIKSEVGIKFVKILEIRIRKY